MIGSWELRSSGGGISGQTTNYPEGNGNRLVFNDSIYKSYSNGSLSDSGIYHLVEDTSLLFHELRTMIIFDNVNPYDPFRKMMIEVENHQLTLMGDGPDMGYSAYERE